MTAGATYDGPVCYLDGWHYAVVPDEAGHDQPGDRLALGDDGVYRVAAAADTESWHDRKHRGFVLMTPEGGAVGVAVTADEMAEIQKLLDERRAE